MHFYQMTKSLRTIYPKALALEVNNPRIDLTICLKLLQCILPKLNESKPNYIKVTVKFGQLNEFGFYLKKTNVQNRYQIYRVQKGSFPNSLILIACRRHLRPVYCVVYYCVTESMEVPRLIGVVSPQKMRSNALLPLPGMHCTVHHWMLQGA